MLLLVETRPIKGVPPYNDCLGWRAAELGLLKPMGEDTATCKNEYPIVEIIIQNRMSLYIDVLAWRVHYIN